MCSPLCCHASHCPSCPGAIRTIRRGERCCRRCLFHDFVPCHSNAFLYIVLCHSYTFGHHNDVVEHQLCGLFFIVVLFIVLFIVRFIFHYYGGG